jgi:hypothetical protein
LVLPVAEVESGSVSAGLAEEALLPKSDLGENDFRSATTTYADVLPEEPGLEKIEFESGFAKPTVNGQWQKCAGRCFARREGNWVQVWETQPIDMLFQPLPPARIFHTRHGTPTGRSAGFSRLWASERRKTGKMTTAGPLGVKYPG